MLLVYCWLHKADMINTHKFPWLGFYSTRRNSIFTLPLKKHLKMLVIDVILWSQAENLVNDTVKHNSNSLRWSEDDGCLIWRFLCSILFSGLFWPVIYFVTPCWNNDRPSSSCLTSNKKKPHKYFYKISTSTKSWTNVLSVSNPRRVV